ncbi:MAG: DUF2165 family protein [Pseudomonadota bacterium]
MEASLIAGQTVFVWLIALWILLGAIENIRNPKVNRDSVAEVMSMSLMAEMHPAFHAVFRRNRVMSPRAHAVAFRVIVWAESIVAAVLLLAALWLTVACIGVAPVAGAKALAAWGAIGFTLVWGGFLVGGQWFHYWCGYEGAQATHFMAALWGMLTFAILHL